MHISSILGFKSTTKALSRHIMNKICYREQISEKDCGPTAFVNALIYLFKRSDIPTLVIRHVYKDTLDKPKSVGTSYEAMTKLAKWLKSYKKDNFSLDVLVKETDDVVFDGSCLKNKSSCGVLFVYFNNKFGHFITVLYETGEYIYCIDPYPREEETKPKEKEWEWLNPHKYEGCNLRIKRNYINEIKSKEIFRAGKLNERYFILIKRCKNKSRSDNQRM